MPFTTSRIFREASAAKGFSRMTRIARYRVRKPVRDFAKIDSAFSRPSSYVFSTNSRMTAS